MANRWTILAVLFLARFSMAFQFQSVGTLAPLIADEFAASLADIGLLIGLYFAPGILIAIPGGAIAMRFGDRRVVITGMALMLVGGLLMTLGDSWSMLVIGRVLAGIGGVIINVLMTKLLTDWFAGHEMATAMGIFVNSWPLGIAMALFVLPMTAAAGGLLAASLLVLALIALGGVLFAARYQAPQASANAAAAGPSEAGKLPLVEVLLSGLVWALYNTALAMVFSFGPAMLSARGWSLSEAGLTTGLYTFLIAVSVPLGGILADRTGRPNQIIVYSMAGFGLLLVALPYVPLGIVLIAFVIMGLISGLPAGPIMTLPSRVLPPEARALGMGVFFTVYYAVFMVAPSFAGLIAEITGDIRMTMVLGAAMLAAALAAFVAFRRITE